MRVIIAAVGKPKDRHLAGAIEEYETRAARYWPLEVIEVREGSGRGIDAELAKEREGARLMERIPPAAMLLVCDEYGEGMTSAEFAKVVAGARDRARDIAFIIGGAFGVAATVRARAAHLIQLAP